MASPGTATAYDLTVGVKVNMDEAIYVYSPMDLPMLTGQDADGLSVVTQAPVDEKQFSWMDEDILTPRSTLAATCVTAATEMVVASGDQQKFSTGDLVYFPVPGSTSTDPEYARVTGYSATTADTLLLSKGYSGTTAQHANGAAVYGVGTALAEGSTPENARTKGRTERSNLTQIFGPTAMSMSRTEQKVAKYGVASEWDRQLFNRLKELNIAREQAMIYGVKTESTTTEIRTTAGLWVHITDNVDNTVTQLTLANLVTQQDLCYNDGRVPELLAANPLSLGDLNSVSDSSRVRVTQQDPRRGRQPVTVIDTEHGTTTVVRNRWLNPEHAIGWSRDNFVRRVLDPMMYQPLAKTGDFDEGQLVGEEGYEVKGQKHCFKMSNLTAY